MFLKINIDAKLFYFKLGKYNSHFQPSSARSGFIFTLQTLPVKIPSRYKSVLIALCRAHLFYQFEIMPFEFLSVDYHGYLVESGMELPCGYHFEGVFPSNAF